MSLAFDTLEAAEQLESAGIEKQHARAIAGTMRDAVTEGVVTKADTARIDGRLDAIEGHLRAVEWVVALHAALTVAIAARLFGVF